MATLDVSILGTATTIIVFMLIFVGGWGVLRVANPFKESDSSKSLYGLIAFLIALLLILSGGMVRVIASATPWLVMLALIGFFLIFFSRMFGAEDKSITNAFTGGGWGWLIFFSALVIVFSLATSFGQDLLKFNLPNQPAPQTTTLPDGTVVVTDPSSVAGPATAGTDFGSNLFLTLFHPKILGVMFLFLLGTLTILMLNVKGGAKA